MASPTMKITELYVYPIKSLPGTTLSSSPLTRTGLAHDRTFMLLRVFPDQTPKNMHITDNPAMALFRTAIHPDATHFSITHLLSPAEELLLPIHPPTDSLAPISITMHTSSTEAYNMGPTYNAWFTARFGFDVVLAYIGANTRPILGTFAPPAEIVPSTWFSYVPFLGGGSAPSAGIGFADCAAFLVVTEASLKNASARLGEGAEVDVRRFRPNVVLGGVAEPWVEDYWGEVGISPPAASAEVEGRGEVSIVLTKNCVRCKSINIDYGTGENAAGPAGSMLKKLMADRRVDAGAKWSPVFGRYGYLGKGENTLIKVGDEVRVRKLNEERSVFDWPL